MSADRCVSGECQLESQLPNTHPRFLPFHQLGEIGHYLADEYGYHCHCDQAFGQGEAVALVSECEDQVVGLTKDLLAEVI